MFSGKNIGGRTTYGSWSLPSLPGSLNFHLLPLLSKKYSCHQIFLPASWYVDGQIDFNGDRTGGGRRRYGSGRGRRRWRRLRHAARSRQDGSSDRDGLGYHGLAPDGEVEYYQVTIQPAPAADVAGRYAGTGEWWVALANNAGAGFFNERWGRWAAGANTWVDVLVGNFAPAPASAPAAAQESSAAPEEQPELAALGFSASTLSPSGQYAEPHRFQKTGRLHTELRDPAAARLDLFDTVMHELTYLRLAADDDPARVTPAIPAGIRRLVRAGEPVDWQSLLDDQAFEPLRLDAYFASLA